MTGILVLTAVELEARALARELELRRVPGHPFSAYEPSSNRPRLRLAPVGVRAALLPDRWSALVAGLQGPLVISAGVCGALAPELGVGDLVIPESVLGPGGERLNVTPGAHRAAVSAAGHACTGCLLTSAELVATPEAKAARWAETGAWAVDMESAAIVAWASRQGCPSLVVRAVADPAGQHVPAELIDLLTPEGKLRTRRALALVLSRPTAIRHALALRGATRRALNSVARLIAALTE